jgi:hypothetical protein
MPHFGASLTKDVKVVIYDRNMFIIQATDCDTVVKLFFFIAKNVAKQARAYTCAEFFGVSLLQQAEKYSTLW